MRMDRTRFVARNLPVTIGNVIGGALFVGIVYRFVYLRSRAKAAAGRPGAWRGGGGSAFSTSSEEVCP